MQRWALAVFNLLCCLYAIKLIFDITDDLKDAYADKIRMEFCIDVLGRNDEKTELWTVYPLQRWYAVEDCHRYMRKTQKSSEQRWLSVQMVRTAVEMVAADI